MRSWLWCIGFFVVLGGCVEENTIIQNVVEDTGSSNETAMDTALDVHSNDTDENTLDSMITTTDTTFADSNAPQDTGEATPDVTIDTSTEEPDLPTSNGCGKDPGRNDRAWTLQHDGIERTFYVHLPPGYDPQSPMPVVLGFHGRAANAGLQIQLSGMFPVSNTRGFIAVHPEGTSGGIEQVWNAGVCCGSAVSSNVDDVGFVSAMIDHLEDELCIDTRRVYATGMSNGGFFTNRLGCELSDKITAIAPVAGTIATLNTFGMIDCDPERAVPVIHFHGTGDNVVPYGGFFGFISVESSIDHWVSQNGCNSASTTFFEQDDVVCEVWSGCSNSVDVRLCTIDDGGHTWPGGFPMPLFGRTTNTISASQMMWEFFQNHTL